LTFILWCSKIGHDANSAAVVANAWQHRSDVMVSAAVFLGITGSHFGYPILDPAVACVVSGIIIKQVGATIALLTMLAQDKIFVTSRL
jgi:divalent metal cation (Fe/Co/Zn/Cd) transporter